MKHFIYLLALLFLVLPAEATARKKPNLSRKKVSSKKRVSSKKKLTMVGMDRLVTRKLGRAPKRALRTQFKKRFAIKKIVDVQRMISSLIHASLAGKLDRSAFNALGMGHGDYFNMFTNKMGGGVGNKTSFATSLRPGNPALGSAAGVAGLSDPVSMIQNAANVNAGFRGNTQSQYMTGSGEEGVTTEVEAMASSSKSSSTDADGNVTTETEVVHASTVGSSDGSIQTSTKKSSTDTDGNGTFMQIVTHTDGQGGWKTSVTHKTRDSSTGKWTGYTRYEDSTGVVKFKQLGSALPPDMKTEGRTNTPLTPEEKRKFQNYLTGMNGLKGGDGMRPGVMENRSIRSFADSIIHKLKGTKGRTTNLNGGHMSGEGQSAHSETSSKLDANGNPVNTLIGPARHTK